MNSGINFFDDLNSENINYVVWKNTNLIKQFYEGKENLDIYKASLSGLINSYLLRKSVYRPLDNKKKNWLFFYLIVNIKF